MLRSIAPADSSTGWRSSAVGAGSGLGGYVTRSSQHFPHRKSEDWMMRAVYPSCRRRGAISREEPACHAGPHAGSGQSDTGPNRRAADGRAPVVRKSFSARARPCGGAAMILRPPFAHIIRCCTDRAICFPMLASSPGSPPEGRPRALRYRTPNLRSQ